MSKVILLLGFIINIHFLAQTKYNVIKYPSGDDEIDRLRKEVFQTPTNWDNYDVRILIMKLWAVSLQQQGVWLGERYYEIDRHLNKYSKWNPVFKGEEEQIYTEKDMTEFIKVIQNGYSALNEIEKDLIENPTSVDYGYLHPRTKQVPEPPKKEDIDWAHYKANPQRTGYSGADGPVKGKIAWEFRADGAVNRKVEVDTTLFTLAQIKEQYIV